MYHLRSISLGKTKNGETIYLDPETRRTHLHIIGQSGRGKSYFMEHMIREDILNGNGLCLIDPHGSLYDNIVNWCEAKKIHKYRKVVLFDPTDPDQTFGFNPLRGKSSEVAYLVDMLMKAMIKVWGTESTDESPRLERCLSSLLWVLAEQGHSLVEARYLINATDNKVRVHLANQIHNPDIKREWDYWNGLKARQFFEQFESTINRFNRFFRFPVVMDILGQLEDTIDFKAIMDEGLVVLVNLKPTKGILSEEASRLLGTLLVNDLYLRSLERTKKEAEENPFYLYIDECYRYLTNDIPHILDECRKFGLHLILAHQRLGQLRDAGDNIYNAVMSIENKAIFGGILAEDAEILAKNIFFELNLEEPKKLLFKPFTVGHKKIRLQSHGHSVGESRGQSHSASSGTSSTDSVTTGTSVTDDITTETDMQGVGQGSFYIESHGESTSLSESETWGWVEALAPVLKWLPTQVYSLEEQTYKAVTAMVRQPVQHAIIKLGTKRTKFVETPTINPEYSKDEWVREFKNKCYQNSNFAKPKQITAQRIKQRLLTLEKKAREPKKPLVEEPKSWKE